MSDDNSGIVYGPDGSVTISATAAKAAAKKKEN